MKQQRKPYRRIRFEDRQMIEKMVSEGKTTDEMALIIGVNSATMFRELKRGGEPYKAAVAQQSL
ncbi:MAG: helix-turn-helix domain-containing protein [Clostridia bacterium]|nr:helix-turn-helix domain-containing protein [Clostridia bacterium]